MTVLGQIQFGGKQSLFRRHSEPWQTHQKYTGFPRFRLRSPDCINCTEIVSHRIRSPYSQDEPDLLKSILELTAGPSVRKDLP